MKKTLNGVVIADVGDDVRVRSVPVIPPLMATPVQPPPHLGIYIDSKLPCYDSLYCKMRRKRLKKPFYTLVSPTCNISAAHISRKNIFINSSSLGYA